MAEIDLHTGPELGARTDYGIGAIGNMLSFARDPLAYLGSVFEKFGPIAMLASLSGRIVVFHTGLALLDTSTGRCVTLTTRSPSP